MRRLRASAARADLINHRFFKEVVHDPHVERGDVAIVLGQWWHPLHYFPDFLVRSICVLSNMSHKSYLADILNEELGEGDPALAHEQIFLETMVGVGFTIAELSQASAFEATQRLVDSYRNGSQARLTALGCAFATEVADLAMVGGIGKLVRRVSGVDTLPWVDIHISQEPNHVNKVTQTLAETFTAEELDVIVAAADAHWQDWCAFFEAIRLATVRAPELA